MEYLWMVEVEHPDGAIFYITSAELPHEAEEKVANALGLPRGSYVLMYRKLTEDEAAEYNLSDGQVIGPM